MTGAINVVANGCHFDVAEARNDVAQGCHFPVFLWWSQILCRLQPTVLICCCCSVTGRGGEAVHAVHDTTRSQSCTMIKNTINYIKVAMTFTN